MHTNQHLISDDWSKSFLLVNFGEKQFGQRDRLVLNIFSFLPGMNLRIVFLKVKFAAYTLLNNAQRCVTFPDLLISHSFKWTRSMLISRDSLCNMASLEEQRDPKNVALMIQNVHIRRSLRDWVLKRLSYYFIYLLFRYFFRMYLIKQGGLSAQELTKNLRTTFVYCSAFFYLFFLFFNIQLLSFIFSNEIILLLKYFLLEFCYEKI